MRAGKGKSAVSSLVDELSDFGEKNDLILFFALLIAHFDAFVIVTAPMIESAPIVKTKHGCQRLGSDFLKNIQFTSLFGVILTEEKPYYARRYMKMIYHRQISREYNVVCR